MNGVATRTNCYIGSEGSDNVILRLISNFRFFFFFRFQHGKENPVEGRVYADDFQE